MGGRGGGKGGGSATAAPAAGRDSSSLTKDSNFSRNQEKSFDAYIANSDYINMRLRTGYKTGVKDLDKAIAGDIRNFDAAMKAAPGLPRMTLYRGMFVADAEKFVNGGKIGSLIRDKGFVSTSHSNYLNAFKLDANVLLKIHVPKGSRGINFGVRNPREREIVLDRGSAFRITKAVKIDGVWNVTATLTQKPK